MSEQEMQQLEDEFPTVAASAFIEARSRALASGQSVLQSDGDVIYEVFPDGRKVAVKRIEPPTPAIPGSVFSIR